ncbi:MAG: hypothetical protein PHE83_14975 [Opitutaceae bacterium]|nr:hypothetical protein [Opitutaceae bacterium]
MVADRHSGLATLSHPLEALGAQVPLVDLSGGIMIFRDGSLAAGFSLQVPVTSLLPDELRYQYFDGLRVALRLLPPDIGAQMVYGQESRPADVVPLLEFKGELPSLVQAAVRARTAALAAALAAGRLRVTTLDFYVSVPPPVPPRQLSRRVSELAGNYLANAPARFSGFMDTVDRRLFRPVEAALNSLFDPYAGTAILALDEYQRARARLVAVAEQVQTSLLQGGFNPRPLQADDLLRRLYRRWNPGKFEAGLVPRPYRANTSVPVAEHFISSDFDWDPSGRRVPKGLFFLDGYYHQVLTLRMPPEWISFPHFEEIGLFSGLNRLELVVNLKPGSTADRIKALQDERKAIENNQKSELNARKLEEISLELRELGTGEEKTWLAQHLFLLRAPTPEELARQAQTLQSAGQRAQSAEITEEIHRVLGYWLAAQPGWSRDQDLNRHNIFNTRQLVATLPAFGGERVEKGDRIGAVYETTDGSLFNLFLHNPRKMSSPNLLVVGAPGKGKSANANTLFTQLCRHQPRLAIIDIGSSYRRLCESLGGAFIRYDIRSDHCRINPFDVFRGRSADPIHFQAVILLLAMMVQEKGGNAAGLKNEERAALEDALTTMIRQRQGKTFFLGDYRETLQSLGTRAANDLATRLLPYVAGGTYAHIFDGPSNVPTQAKIVVFELKQCKENSPELLPVVFQVILQHIVALANDFPDDLKVLGMDEAHQLLAEPTIRQFVELAFRTFRKLDVGIVGISQGIQDWIIPEKPMAILQTVSAVLACGQSPESADQLANIYHLSANEKAALQNLQMVHGSYAEAMAIQFTPQGRQSVVCINRMQPIEYAMSTTDPADLRVLARLEDRLKSVTEATLEFARRYPRGVRAAGGPAPEDDV